MLSGQEIELFNKRPSLVDRLWQTGGIVFNGIDINLPVTSVRDQPGILRYRKMTTFLLYELQYTTPVLNTFPDLHVSLQARVMTARMWNGKLKNLAVDFSYRKRDCTVFLNHQADLTEEVFAHELGHHVNGYFSEQDWLDFLDKQKWRIQKKENHEMRLASLEDIQLLSQQEDPTKPPEDEWILFNPVYDEDARDWVKGREYRHTNPNEMVAVIFAENYRKILEYVNRSNGTNQRRQRKAIRYLIAIIPVF